ncbi:hypothetical protein JTE90_003943 [Oedothorax gibbosus]|uniref:Uncharacterized protein n=1 Tax=Oedothorax gibbosus TaxID=931172 RepID=A0AAV6UXX2_9ARAC|nr:hypothetical protein JTE90_003943 [Oedothorax gibbosus]
MKPFRGPACGRDDQQDKQGPEGSGVRKGLTLVSTIDDIQFLFGDGFCQQPLLAIRPAKKINLDPLARVSSLTDEVRGTWWTLMDAKVSSARGGAHVTAFETSLINCTLP